MSTYSLWRDALHWRIIGVSPQRAEANGTRVLLLRITSDRNRPRGSSRSSVENRDFGIVRSWISDNESSMLP